MTNRFLKYSASTCFLLFIFLGIPMVLWSYSIAIELNKRLNQKSQTKILPIKISLWVMVLYMFIGPILFLLTIISKANLSYILPLHFGVMLTSLFLLVKASTILTKFETENKIKKSDFLVNLFLIALAPLGVWIIQPNVNKYLEYPKIKTAVNT